MMVFEDGHDLTALAERINAEHEQCGTAARTSLEHAMKAGALLLEAKALVPYGQWTAWLRDNCTVTERTAQTYMQIARDMPALIEQDRTVLNTVLSVTGARALIAGNAPSEPEPPTLYDAPPTWAEQHDDAPSSEMSTAPYGEPELPTPYEAAVAAVDAMDARPEWERTRVETAAPAREPAPEPVQREPAPLHVRLAAWDKTDGVGQMLEKLNVISMTDPTEIAQRLTGIEAAQLIIETHRDIAERGAAWLRDYSHALGARLGHDTPKLRSVQ